MDSDEEVKHRKYEMSKIQWNILPYQLVTTERAKSLYIQGHLENRLKKSRDSRV